MTSGTQPFQEKAGSFLSLTVKPSGSECSLPGFAQSKRFAALVLNCYAYCLIFILNESLNLCILIFLGETNHQNCNELKKRQRGEINKRKGQILMLQSLPCTEQHSDVVESAHSIMVEAESILEMYIIIF